MARVAVVAILVMTGYACEYNEIVDWNYPESVIYLPAANRGILPISQLDLSDLPRYTFDFQQNTLNIPLGVYRSGLSNSDQVTIQVNIDPGAIVNSELVNVELLPIEHIRIPSTVNLEGGSDFATFEVVVDTDFLIENSDKSYAFSIEVSSDQIKSNESLNSVLVIVQPGFLKPTSGFSFNAVDGDPLSVAFVNESLNASTYKWDFGDGNTSTEMEPSHSYSMAGTYKVTLTTIGLAGNDHPSVKSMEIEIK